MHGHKFIATNGGFSVLNGSTETPVINQNGSIVPSSVFGNTYYVDYRNGSDGNNGKSPSEAFKTLSAAYAAVTDNNNDVIYIDGDSTVVETAMITWAKNRVHVIGVGGNLRYGQGAKVSLTATAGATNIATLKVTGVRNSFTNIKWINNSTVDEGLYCVAEGGEYTSYTNCEFYKSTDLDQTTAAEVVLNGDSTQFFNCNFGSLADAQTGTTIRPNIKLAKGTVGAGLVSRDVLFENCMFWKKSSHTTSAFISSTSATDVERTLTLRNCLFINAKLSTAVPAQAIATTTLTDGYIVADNCSAVNCTKVSTSTGVIVIGPAVNTGAGIGVNAA
jgi:hypothetical protein